MANDSEAPASKASRVEAMSYLLVRTGETRCALPLAAVRRVVRALAVSPLPGARPELLGLAEFGGDPLPVLDLAALLGEPPGPRPSFPVTVVLRLETSEALGLAADEALEVVNLAAEAVVRHISSAGAAGRQGVVAGEALVDDRPVRLLDLAALSGEP